MKQMEYFSICTTMDVENLDIMMGSGKLDKQDNEIFEGDWVYIKEQHVSERSESTDRIREETCKIIYENSAFLIEKSPFVKEYLRDFNPSHWTVIEFKIVGNIYDTK